MKKILFYTILLVFSTTTYAYNPPDSTSNIIEKGTAQYLISEGKRLFSEGKYRVALVKFREALVKDKNNPDATYWVGESHLALGNYKKAIEYAEKAIKKDSLVNKESGYLLGVSYHRLGELDKGILYYKQVKSKVRENRAKELNLNRRIAECERAKEMMKAPVDVKIEPMSMSINSAFDDYAPTLAADGKTFYFVSRRADNKGGGVNPADQRFFEDIYVATWNEETNSWNEGSNSSDIIRRLNTKGFDAVNHITSDGKYLYVTLNTTAVEDPRKKTKSSDLFVSKMNIRGGWNSPKSLGKPLNSIVFDASASITEDGNTLYYVSERKGGKGRADIWMSRKTGRNWAKPVNLGAKINTSGQETTVYVTPDEKYLFFSSDSHEGMGGYDVYVCKNVNGEWSAPVNMGYPINTVSDETHFTYYPDKKKAYYSTFSSTENKGIGARDIFEVDMSNYEFNFPEEE